MGGGSELLGDVDQAEHELRGELAAHDPVAGVLAADEGAEASPCGDEVGFRLVAQG